MHLPLSRKVSGSILPPNPIQSSSYSINPFSPDIAISFGHSQKLNCVHLKQYIPSLNVFLHGWISSPIAPSQYPSISKCCIFILVRLLLPFITWYHTFLLRQKYNFAPAAWTAWPRDAWATPASLFSATSSGSNFYANGFSTQFPNLYIQVFYCFKV